MPRMDQYDIKAAPTVSDQLLIIDVEDGSQSPEGTTKRAVIGTLPGSGGGGAVSSVFGRTGAVAAQTGDYTAAQVGADPAGAAAAAQAASIPLAQKGAANGVATLDGSSLVPAAQIPQLADYAPTGLTGATAPTRYGGGTPSGHPLSGTWAVGDWVVDETGKIYVCIAAGTPGTWRRAGSDPWQFFIDDYAKGDGVQALVNTTAASAVISTTPLGAPAAPTISNSATGGTILAGVYQVIVTYVNRWGESLGSSVSSTTTTGSTSTITINSPASVGNAAGWYAYVTGPGGATFFRQQAAGSPTVIQDELVLTAPPASSGANPPGADTTAAQVFTSTAVDGGKNIMIQGGLGSPGAPWIDTIATVQSPTQATLSSNGSGQGGNVTAAGCGMVFASDDRLAIDQCVQAAEAYLAAPGHNLVQLIAGAKIYGLGIGLFQSTNAQGTAIGGYGVDYNTQLRLPSAARIISGEESKIEVALLGPGDSSHGQFWVSRQANLTGASFVSFSLGPATADPTYGQQSIIGAPAPGSHNGNVGFGNYKAVIQGVQAIHPGWDNSIGIDLQWIGGCRVRAGSMAYAPSTNDGGGVNPCNAWTNNSFWLAKISAGLRAPNGGNNDDVVIESWASEGMNRGLVCEADHLTVHRLATICCDWGIEVASFDGNTHDLTINQWSIEACNAGIATHGGSGHITVHIVMDGENSSLVDVSDTGNAFYGVLYWSDPFRSPAVPTIQGAQNLNIINCMRGPAVVPRVTQLTFGASIPLQADFGNVFTLTLTASTGTLATPTNPQDGQTIRIRVIQGTGGGFTLAFSSAYDFGTAGQPTLSTAAGKVDVLGFEYVASLSKWVYLGSALGN